MLRLANGPEFRQTSPDSSKNNANLNVGLDRGPGSIS